MAMPVESWAEKLSPMPWMLPLVLGSEMAWLVTPLLSAPLGKDAAGIAGATGVEDTSTAVTGLALTLASLLFRTAGCELWRFDDSATGSSDSA
ncbi:MAG: hypothetical protein AMXMBFR56_78370 [Polyangiaceae bacterium]